MSDVWYASIVSSFLAKGFMYPSDVIKLNLQLGNKSIISTSKNIYYRDGVLGFYKGVSYACCKNCVLYGSRFLSFERLKTKYNLFYASILSALCQSILTFPLEYLRMKTIFGTKSSEIYKGISAAMIISILYTITDFGVYYNLESYVGEDTNNIFNQPFMRGGLSTFCAQSLIYPIDTYMRSKITGLKYIFLYRGFLFNSFRVVPSGAIYYGLYDMIKKS